MWKRNNRFAHKLPEAQVTLSSVQPWQTNFRPIFSISNKVASPVCACNCHKHNYPKHKRNWMQPASFAQNACPLDEVVLKDYVSDYTRRHRCSFI